MKPQSSPLQILDFALTALEFKMIPPDSEQVDMAQYFRDYELDIDFTLSNDHFLNVYIKAEVNRDGKFPGYSMIVEAACIFKFDAGDLEESIQLQLEGFSTIYIALNSLRGLISNFTANAPFGRYIFPSIDLNDLIEKKKQAGKGSHIKTQPVGSADK